MRLRTATITLLLLGFASELIGQDNRNIQLLGKISTNGWENYATAIAKEGRFTYIAVENSGVKIVDVTDANLPVEVGGVNLNVSYFEIAVQRSIVYVAAGVNGLIIMDFTNPAEPHVLAQMREVGNARGVDVLADTAYVAIGDGVAKVNCADLANPRIINVWRSDGFALKVRISPPYGYVAAGEGGLEIFDLYQGINPIGNVEAMGETRDLCVAGASAWLAETDGVSQIDVSNPQELVRVANRRTDYPVMAVAAQQGKLFGSMPDDQSIRVFDMANQLVELSEIVAVADDIIAQQGLIYIATDRPAPLTIFLLDQDNQPQKIGQLGYQTIFRNVAKRGNYLYSAEWPTHLAVYSLADSSRPALIWTAAASTRSLTFSQEMVIRDTLLYIYDQNLSIYNLINPEVPELISVVELHRDGPHHLTISGNRAFCQPYAYYLIDIIDISNPRNPNIVGSIRHQNDGILRDIKVVGNIAYIIAEDDALIAFDISDLRDVRMVDRIATRGEPWSLELVGDRLYVCTLANFEVIDISDPLNFNILGSFGIGVDDPEANIVGDHAFIASYNEGFRIIDITDPANMNEVGRFDTDGTTCDIEVNDGILYVADYDNLGTYDCSAALPVIENFFTPIPSTLSLSAFPNPFNSSTTINYSLPTPGRYAIDVIDIQGRLVTRLSDGWREAGSYREVWEGADVAGLYLINVRFECGDVLSKRALLIK